MGQVGPTHRRPELRWGLDLCVAMPLDVAGILSTPLVLAHNRVATCSAILSCCPGCGKAHRHRGDKSRVTYDPLCAGPSLHVYHKSTVKNGKPAPLALEA